MKDKIPSFLLDRLPFRPPDKDKRGIKLPFIEKGIHGFANIIRTSYIQWELSSGRGFSQNVDARVKVLFLLFFIIIVSLKRDLLSEVFIGCFVFLLVLISRLDILNFYRRVLLLGFIFGFLVALPSAFNIITKGDIIFPILHLSGPYTFWIYSIPKTIGITEEGTFGVIMLTLRIINSLSLSFLVLYTTPFHEIIKALKVLKTPDSFLLVITLSYKYIFLFAKTAGDMHLAKKSRLAGTESHKETRRWVTGRLAFMFKKTKLKCEDIFNAMLSRGFSDDIRVYGFRKLNTGDWFVGLVLILTGILFLFI